MDIQWYPGHMTKAKRNMQEDCRLVDLIIELVDARAPFGSRNPDIDRLGQGKARLILMNKSDLADPSRSAAWKAWFEEKGFFVVLLDARASSQMKAVYAVIEQACHEKRERPPAGDLEPAGTGDGRRDPQRREIDFYQYLCRPGGGEDRQ